MTKESFLEKVNQGRYPKYVFSQVREDTPQKDCVAIVCTISDQILIAKYEYGIWKKACFTSAEDGKQEIYHTNINEGIKYWTGGKAEDRSKRQFES